MNVSELYPKQNHGTIRSIVENDRIFNRKAAKGVLKMTIKWYLNKLSVKIIGSIVILVTLLTIVVGFFSYQVFTRTMLKEATETLSQSADYSMNYAVKWRISDYLSVGAERMDQLLASNFTEILPDDPEWIVDITKAYFASDADYVAICRSRNISAIALIVPDETKNFGEYTIINAYSDVYDQISDDAAVSVIDPDVEINDEEPEATEDPETPEDWEDTEEPYEPVTDWINLYEPAILGTKYPLENEELQAALRRLWRRDTTTESLIDFEGDHVIGPKITCLQAVEGGGAKPDGILVLVQSIGPMVDSWNRFVVGITLIATGMIIIGILILGIYIRTRVVNPVDQITKEAYRFARENKKAENTLAGNVGSITEICVLAESIDKMEEDTINNMDKIAIMSRESDRMDTELSFAADLQRSVLPDAEEFSTQSQFHVAAQMIPAREVGGDFYDYFMIDDNHLAILIADVSDKGIGAALFMAVSKMLLKARAGMGGHAAEIITYVEEKLNTDNKAGMFVTVWLGILDLTTGKVNACNAGHAFPAILKADTDEGYRIDKTVHGPPVCFLPGMGHVEYDFQLDPGDRIFLYTDGVTEAKRSDGERFGNDRLISALNEDRDIGDESLILRVKAAVEHFAGEEPQFDDMTMVSVTYLGTV